MKKKLATLLAALTLLAVAPVTAQAQDDVVLSVHVQGPLVDSTVSVSLLGCTTPTTATSPGFVAPVKLEPDEFGVTGTVQVVSQAGGYTATADCDGTTYSTQFVVRTPSLNEWSLEPVVDPGGDVYSRLFPYACNYQGAITSPGFSEPLILQRTSRPWVEGTVKAVTKPGTYRAYLFCEGVWRPYNKLFTVRG
ncbi:hypothetical protein ACFWNN_30935 [Lentzea sp. NPDC058450]|uniref:hypothetical protein n=1 Tax=Lentzea sp. NPDC058450 TaxID=3346505 RepID=UPI0036591B9F